jgi:hypothetical protein
MGAYQQTERRVSVLPYRCPQLLSAVSVLVVAHSSSDVPEGLMNHPVYLSASGLTPGVTVLTLSVTTAVGKTDAWRVLFSKQTSTVYTNELYWGINDPRTLRGSNCTHTEGLQELGRSFCTQTPNSCKLTNRMNHVVQEIMQNQNRRVCKPGIRTYVVNDALLAHTFMLTSNKRWKIQTCPSTCFICDTNRPTSFKFDAEIYKYLNTFTYTSNERCPRLW